MYAKSIRRVLTALVVTSHMVLPTGAWAEGQSPYVGQIMWVSFNFAPRGWATCDGQLLPLSQNTALFSLLGTQYGGNGTSNFALPDMRGRVLINAGQGAGLYDYRQGESGGEEPVTLLQSEMPAHTHAIQATTNVADQTNPAGNVLGQAQSGNLYSSGGTTTMAPGALALQGGGQPHNNMMPYTTLNCIIALQGVFPARP